MACLHSWWRQSSRVHGGYHVGKGISRSNKGDKVEEVNKEEHIEPKSRICYEFRKPLGRAIGIDRVQDRIGNHRVGEDFVGFIILEIIVVIVVFNVVKESLILQHIRRVHDAFGFVSIVVFVATPSPADSCELAFSLIIVVDGRATGTQSARTGNRLRI